MNRKVTVAVFPPGMCEHYGEDAMSLHSLKFQVLGMVVENEFEYPLVLDKDEEFVIRINLNGATLEFSKLVPNALREPHAGNKDQETPK